MKRPYPQKSSKRRGLIFVFFFLAFDKAEVEKDHHRHLNATRLTDEKSEVGHAASLGVTWIMMSREGESLPVFVSQRIDGFQRRSPRYYTFTLSLKRKSSSLSLL